MTERKLCKKCTEALEKGATYVEGEGTKPARFLILGESPGAAEVEKGRPFIGESGYLLRKTLRSLGGTKLLNDVYLDNAVRVSTRGAPGMPHLRSCEKECFQTVVDLVSPEAILCVGISGLKMLTDNGNVGITAARGEVFHYTPKWEGAEPIPVMVTWSTGKIVKEPDYYEWWVDDIAAFLMDECYIRRPFEVRYREREDLPPSVGTDVNLDVETTGFEPWKGHSLRCTGVANLGGLPTVVNAAKGYETIRRNLIMNPEARIHGANIPFDLMWFLEDMEIPRCKAVDSQYLHYLWDERYENRKLKHLFMLYTDYEQYGLKDGGVNDKIEDVMKYNAQDVKANEIVEAGVREDLANEGLNCSRLELLMEDVVPVLAGMMHTGMHIDREQLQLVKGMEKRKVTEAVKGMAEVWDRHMDEPWDIGILSRYADLSDFLFKTLALPKPRTEKPLRQDGRISTAAANLEWLLKNDKDPTGFIPALFQYRAVHENYKKYVLDVLRRTDDNNRIHPKYNYKTSGYGDKKQGTVTGRLSVSKPALQNTPDGHPMRTAFIPLPGHTHLFQIDLSTIELTILAQIAQDKELTQVLTKGEDLHQWAADTATQMGHPMSRKMAKIVNFGILYGIGAKGLAGQTSLTREGADAVKKAWFKRFGSVNKYKERLEYEALNQGWVEAPHGQRRHFPKGLRRWSKEGGRAQRQAFNFVIQSTANVLNLLIMADFARNRLDLGFPLASIHDAIIISTGDPDGLTHYFHQYFCEELVENFGWLIDQKIVLPIRAESQLGKNWGEMQPHASFTSEVPF